MVKLAAGCGPRRVQIRDIPAGRQRGFESAEVSGPVDVHDMPTEAPGRPGNADAEARGKRLLHHPLVRPGCQCASTG